DGNSGKAVVVEKSPERVGIREAQGDWIVCANHYLTSVLAQDPKNLNYMRHSSTLNRQQRMEEMVAGAAGKLDPFTAATMLRDRGGDAYNTGGGMDPKAINTLIATHSVIGDETAGILWVSAGPHQLGEYVPFSVLDFAAPVHEPLIPADPFLLDGRYERYMKNSKSGF
ncbi:MAG TPA: carcinine hydrolase/isopenicillin-N N-acyltransferase family protein, partial [bacterium]|nr:carcinine hydrolase/isopenicillin-N N-acyltransferase family protein [bacterium]